MNKKNILVISIFLLLTLFLPQLALADNITFANPLLYNTVEGFLGVFLQYLQGIIVVISIIFIVIGALMYMFAGVNKGMIETGKKAITASIIGLAIGVAAPSFLKEIYKILDVTDPCATITEAVAKAACEADQAKLAAAASLAEIAFNTLNFLLSITGVLAMLILVIGGIMYLTSAGDQKKTEDAQKLIKYAIVGLLIAILSLVIVKQVALLFAA